MPSTSRRDLYAFATAAAVFLLLDAIWLSVMASRLYRPALGHVMREDFDLLAAALFYTIYLIGVVAFVVRASTGGRDALVRGAGFGLVCYATYDLTNQATVVGWPWHVTFVDLCWGAFVTAVAAFAAQRVSRGRAA